MVILRGRQFIAFLGAVIIVATLALDPLYQQVVHINAYTMSSNASNATLPRTSVYNLEVGKSGSMDTPMQGAIMAGFYMPGPDANTITVEGCFTGNCTFSDYDTVQVSSNCTDNTDQISGTCQQTHDGQGNTTLFCTYSLPSGTSLSQGQDVFEYFTSNWSTPDDSNGWLAGKEFIFFDLNVTQFATPNATCAGPACGIQAAQCYLYPSVGTYNAIVANGILTETLLSTTPLALQGQETETLDFCWTNFKTSCLTQQDLSTIAAQGIVVNQDDDFVPWCFGNGTTLSDISASCVYDFSNTSAAGFLDFFGMYDESLTSFLNGSVTGPAYYNGTTATAASAEGPYDLTFFWNGGSMNLASINWTFASIAQSVSARIRVAGDPAYSTPAQGLVLVNASVVHVVYAWLSLPIAMIILSVVFLVVTMIQTSTKGHKPIGKAFSIALLMDGVAGTMSDQSPELKYVHQGLSRERNVLQAHEQSMGQAEASKVQFRETEEGWRLVRISSE